MERATRSWSDVAFSNVSRLVTHRGSSDRWGDHCQPAARWSGLPVAAVLLAQRGIDHREWSTPAIEFDAGGFAEMRSEQLGPGDGTQPGDTPGGSGFRVGPALHISLDQGLANGKGALTSCERWLVEQAACQRHHIATDTRIVRELQPITDPCFDLVRALVGQVVQGCRDRTLLGLRMPMSQGVVHSSRLGNRTNVRSCRSNRRKLIGRSSDHRLHELVAARGLRAGT